MGKINFETIPEKLRPNTFKVLAIFTIFTLAMVSGITRLKVDMSAMSFFTEDNPTVELYTEFRRAFGGDNGVYIVYEAKDGDIFSNDSLNAVKGIQEDLTEYEGGIASKEGSILDHIVEVTTIVNVEYLQGKNDTLVSDPFIEDRMPLNKQEQEEVRNQALNHPDYPLLYLSKDSRYGGIYLRTDFEAIPEEGNFDESSISENISQEFQKIKFKSHSMLEYADFTSALEEVISQPKYSEHLKFYKVGNPVLMAFFHDVIEVELGMLFGIALALMLVVLFVLFRSLSAVLWPLLVVALTIGITLGFIGWAGLTMSTMIIILMMLCLVVGISDSVHILSGYLFFRRQGYDYNTAMRKVYKKSGLACMLTSITTSIAMFSLTVVPIPPIRYFGIGAGVGVIVAFMITITVLPLMMDLWQPFTKKHKQKSASMGDDKVRIQLFLEKFIPFSHQKPKGTCLAFLIVTIISAWGMTRIKVDTNMVDIVKDDLALPVAHRLIDKVMAGTQSMEIFLQFKSPDALKDPKVLSAMDQMQSKLEKDYKNYVVKTVSLVDSVKDAFQSLNRDDKDKYVIPSDRTALAQTLFLFDSANPDDRRQLVTDDYRQARISVRLYNYGSSEYLDFFQSVNRDMELIFSPLKSSYSGLEYEITGGLALMMELFEYMSWSQVKSFGLALVVVSIILLVVFGSVKTGLIAILPNVFPVLVTFGIMGFLGIPLDADTLIIAPLVIGVSVDDTIHFLVHYRMEFQQNNDKFGAIAGSIKQSGQAICFTSLIIVLGFLILVISIHQGMAHFGLLIAVAFSAAVLADLLWLPSLVAMTNIKFARKKEAPHVAS
ncbi:MAG: MMPL family transporter [Proteobacteria bacterium]|nr:MMPL family transporter [Pseudomonadota bacterium]